MIRKLLILFVFQANLFLMNACFSTVELTKLPTPALQEEIQENTVR